MQRYGLLAACVDSLMPITGYINAFVNVREVLRVSQLCKKFIQMMDTISV